jgi:hypothetical protein
LSSTHGQPAKPAPSENRAQLLQLFVTWFAAECNWVVLGKLASGEALRNEADLGRTDDRGKRQQREDYEDNGQRRQQRRG